jgi:hypothetical protein
MYFGGNPYIINLYFIGDSHPWNLCFSGKQSVYLGSFYFVYIIWLRLVFPHGKVILQEIYTCILFTYMVGKDLEKPWQRTGIQLVKEVFKCRDWRMMR